MPGASKPRKRSRNSKRSTLRPSRTRGRNQIARNRMEPRKLRRPLTLLKPLKPPRRAACKRNGTQRQTTLVKLKPRTPRGSSKPRKLRTPNANALRASKKCSRPHRSNRHNNTHSNRLNARRRRNAHHKTHSVNKPYGSSRSLHSSRPSVRLKPRNSVRLNRDQRLRQWPRVKLHREPPQRPAKEKAN